MFTYLCCGGGVGVRDRGKLATSLVTESDRIEPNVWSGDKLAPTLCTMPLLEHGYRLIANQAVHGECTPQCSSVLTLKFSPNVSKSDSTRLCSYVSRNTSESLIRGVLTNSRLTRKVQRPMNSNRFETSRGYRFQGTKRPNLQRDKPILLSFSNILEIV